MAGWVTELAICFVADQGLRSADVQGWLSPEQLAELAKRQQGAHGFVIRRLREDNGNHWPDLKQLDCNGQFHLAVLIVHQ